MLLLSVTLLACTVGAISLLGLNSLKCPIAFLNTRLSLPFCLALPCLPFPPPFAFLCVRCQVPPCSHSCARHSIACCHLRSSHLNAAIFLLLRCESTCMRVCFLEHSPDTFFLLPYLFSSLCSLLSCARYVVTANQQVLDCQQAHVSCSSYPKVVPLHVVHLHVAAVAHLMFESFHF